MLQKNVYGFTNVSATNSIPMRLGYWRFDSPLLYAEQGQMPLSSSNVATVASWSGTALSIGSNASSQVTYPDVGSNGWANINCRQGSVRFWFKKNGSPASELAPFVYMGDAGGVKDVWTLELTSSNTINFVTQTNELGVDTVLHAAAGGLSTSKWTQIVLNYGPTNCSLYTNGILAATGAGNTNWPSLSNRQLGLVIGNNMIHNAAINGQFEEMETFNYQLSASQILSNFQIVSNVDSDLDGVPDYLEDINLSTNRPFLGAPVAITGTIEAEQFDMGGPGIAYSNSSTHAASGYRPTGMFITNCTDLAGGYCLSQTQSNDWALYTIYVPVGQNYVIDARVAGLGFTGGVFKVEFTNASYYTNTGPLTIASTTNWIDVTSVVYLQTGTYTMKLHCLTNAPGTNYVGQFNYISIYPYVPTPTVGTATEYVSLVSSPSLTTNTNYASALSNAVAIQTAVNNLGPGGGTVWITNGTYMVAQASPNELNDAYANAAVAILGSNVKIEGDGITNTTLIAYNRATTIFTLGKTSISGFTTNSQCYNFTLCNMTIEGQPHEAVSNQIGTNVVYNANQLVAVGDAGALAAR